MVVPVAEAPEVVDPAVAIALLMEEANEEAEEAAAEDLEEAAD